MFSKIGINGSNTSNLNEVNIKNSTITCTGHCKFASIINSSDLILMPNADVDLAGDRYDNVVLKKANGEIVEHGDLPHTRVVSDANNNITLIPLIHLEIAEHRERIENSSSAASVNEVIENSPIDLPPLPNLSHTLLPHEANSNMPNTSLPPVLIESSTNTASTSSPHFSSDFQQAWDSTQPQISDGSVDFNNSPALPSQPRQTSEVFQQVWNSVRDGNDVSNFPNIDEMSSDENYKTFYAPASEEQPSAAASHSSNPSVIDLLIGEDYAGIINSEESAHSFRTIHLPASFTGESSTIHAFEQTQHCGTADPVMGFISRL